ncbi:MAG: nucleotide-binding protein [Chloroflexi bacterium]|nr:nucleotide-binding protein [Chloroflexota bacterium]
MKKRARVFIGCSSQAQPIGEAFCRALESEAEMVGWWAAPEFKTGFGILESLLGVLERYDFGIFIFAPDDLTAKKGVVRQSTRDNVLFEFGLFLGHLGRERTFAFVQADPGKAEPLDMPSDLEGVVFPQLKLFSLDPAVIERALTTAAREIRGRITELGPRETKIEWKIGWGYSSAAKRFSMSIKPETLQAHASTLKGKSLQLAAVHHSPSINLEDNPHLALSPVRRIPEYLTGDLELHADGSNVFADIAPGDVIYGFLLLLPGDLALSSCKTVAEMKARGAEDVAIKGERVQ